jgi:hypothetical protein
MPMRDPQTGIDIHVPENESEPAEISVSLFLFIGLPTLLIGFSLSFFDIIPAFIWVGLEAVGIICLFIEMFFVFRQERRR